MTYQGNIRCKTPDIVSTVYSTVEGGEAGEVFENLFFGGGFLRMDDGSNRHPTYMASSLPSYLKPTLAE
jgi:hypothetical protein